MKNIKKQNVCDMTSGSSAKLILRFMLPMTLGLIFQQFYNMVDTIVVGKFIGVKALAGVGSTGSLNFLVVGFSTGICSGFAIPVAQKFGKKDFSDMRKYAVNAVFLAFILSVLIALATGIPCRQILTALHTDPEFFQEAYHYIFILFLGIPAIMMYNMFSGIIRSLGNSRVPLVFIMISSVINIVLDLVTVLVFRMGVEGPAAATVISQAAAGAGCFLYMKKNFNILKTTPEERRPSAPHIRRLCYMGIPMGLQCSITAIGSITLQSVVNHFGTAYVAAIAASTKAYQLFNAPLDALGPTIATFSGQNIGAGRLDRVRSGIHSGLIISAVHAVLAYSILHIFSESFISLFLNTKDLTSAPQVLELAEQYLSVVSSVFMLLAMIYVFRFTIQGVGFSHIAVFSGVFEMFARCFVAFIMVPKMGYYAVCWANAIAWGAADVFLIPCYFCCMRMLQKRYSGNVQISV